jgi:Eukaryotic membrane protein family
LDHSHAVVKRIGFAQIPLICVTFRMLHEAFKYQAPSFVLPQTLYWRVIMAPFVASTSPARRAIVYFCVWVGLLVLKLVLGRLLQRISLEKLYAAPEYSQLTPLITHASSGKKKND